MRVFVIGTNKVTEDESTKGLTSEQVRAVLRPAYPEVANATIREHKEGDTTFVDFIPVAGRKG